MQHAQAYVTVISLRVMRRKHPFDQNKTASVPSVHLLLQMVSVMRICLNFLHTSATFGRTVPGSRENISTKSSGGNSTKDSGCWGPELVRARPLPYSWAWPPGPAVATTPPGPPRRPPASLFRVPTICSPSSSSMSESLPPESCWLLRWRLRQLRDWPTPQSLAQTAIRSHKTSYYITTLSAAVSSEPSLASSRRIFWRHVVRSREQRLISSVSWVLNVDYQLCSAAAKYKWFSSLF